MYQTLEDLEKFQHLENEQNKPKKWIKRILLILGLAIGFFIVLIVYNLNIKKSDSSLTYSDYSEDSDSSDENIKLGEGNIFSRLLQIESEDDDSPKVLDYSESNEKIIEQLKDESFWDRKIEETIEKLEKNSSIKKEVKILGYGLLCKGYTEDLGSCEYSVGYSEDRDYLGDKRHFLNGTKEIAMSDIGNGGVFYDIYDWRTDIEQETIKKYLGKDFESTYEGNFRDIDVSRLLTNNDDGTMNYYLYIIDDNTGEILYKNSEKIISRNNAKKIIAENAGVDTNNVYLDIDKNNLIYESYFSCNGHTYDYKIDAKSGKIIKSVDEKDVGDEKAMEIALKDSGLKATDLRRDVSHGHGIEKTLLMPELNKKGTGNDAVYNIEIETEDDLIYTYQIRATDGKILLKHLSEQFVIYDKEGSKKNITYKIKSVHKKGKELEIKPSELNMDDIYEFRNQIYLWLTFDGDNIVDWSIIDRPYKHMGRMTRNELDEYYNFESHYSTKTIDKIFSESTEIKLSELDENVLYKIKIGQICRLNITNDKEYDVIVYEGYYGSGKYEATPYLKEGYVGSRGCVTVRGNSDDYYSLLYKKASSKDLLKIIDEEEITYLSKFKVGDEINLKQRHNEKYLYNDTSNDLTISVTDYGIINAPEDFQFTVKSGKFAHCYDATDIVKIIK